MTGYNHYLWGTFILRLKYRILINVFPLFSLASHKSVLPLFRPSGSDSHRLLTPQPPGVLLPCLHIAKTFHHIVHCHQRTVLVEGFSYFIKSNIWIFLNIRFKFLSLFRTEDTFSVASRQRGRLSVSAVSHPATHSIHMISKNFRKLTSCRPAFKTRLDHQSTNFWLCLFHECSFCRYFNIN